MKTNVPIQLRYFRQTGQWQPIFTTSFSHSHMNFSCFVWIESPILCTFVTVAAVAGQRAQYSVAILVLFCILWCLTLIYFLYMVFFLPEVRQRQNMDIDNPDEIDSALWSCAGTGNRLEDGGDERTVRASRELRSWTESAQRRTNATIPSEYKNLWVWLK